MPVALITLPAGSETETVPQVLTPEELEAAQRLVRRIPVGEKVVDSILHLVRGARPDKSPHDFVQSNVAWGPGPRASQALILAVRAQALLDGRLSPSIDDVVALAQPVLRHRMALSFAARAEGISISDTIGRLTNEYG